MPELALKLGPADHGRRLALEEYLEAEEDQGVRHELARGVVEIMQVPNDPHGQIQSNLQKVFVLYEVAHPGLILARVHGDGMQVLIPEFASGRNPDFAVILRAMPLDMRGRRPPSLVAEVVSPGVADRDYLQKREEYLSVGTILEYWIIDPRQRQVTVLMRPQTEAGPIWDEAVFRDDQEIVSRLFPGFATAVSSLWQDVDLADFDR